jgi:hypothetical protein
MTYAAHRKDFTPYVGDQVRAKPRAEAGVVRRMLAAIFASIAQSRRRQVERELAQFIARRGGSLTDDVERQMMQFVMTSEWRQRE